MYQHPLSHSSPLPFVITERKSHADTAPRLPSRMLSRPTGCNIETIRYYEKIGLLPAPARSDGDHRLYGHGHLMRLGFVRRARELGFTMDEIRALLRLDRKSTRLNSSH